MKTVYVGGTFDKAHAGHEELFKDIRRIFGMRTRVVVAVNSDAFVKHYKGFIPEGMSDEKTRLHDIEAVAKNYLLEGYVFCFIMPSFEAQKLLLESWDVDFVYHATDWTGMNTPSIYEQYGITQEWCEVNGILFIYTDRRSGVSSTKIRKGLQDGKEV